VTAGAVIMLIVGAVLLWGGLGYFLYRAITGQGFYQRGAVSTPEEEKVAPPG